MLIIDDGFDVTHEVFKDKILETYTITCEQGDQSKVDDNPDFGGGRMAVR